MRSVRAVPLLLALAAGLHLAVLPSHLEEGVAVGAFFAVVAVGQLVAAVAIHRGVGRWTRTLIAAASLGIVAVWLVSRTAGLAVGGHDATPEPIGLLDGLSVLAELAVVGLLVARRPVTSTSRLAGWPAIAGLALVAAAAGLPLAPSADAHQHEPVHTHDVLTPAAHHHSDH